MILLLFGPPGCGKGTQGEYLAKRFRVPAISTGEMLRAECKAGTELGKLAQSILAKGELIGDQIINRVVASRISKPDCLGGFLLDGFPRTVEQARYFQALVASRDLDQPIVLFLDVADESLVKRLTSRRQCPQCKHIYNLLSQPPAAEGRCDFDGTELISREDDREEVIRGRLAAYHQQTGPILAWYGYRRVNRIEGDQSPELVREAIERIVLEKALALVA